MNVEPELTLEEQIEKLKNSIMIANIRGDHQTFMKLFARLHDIWHDEHGIMEFHLQLEKTSISKGD